jgi:lysophospholipase L1-like esterase
MKTRRIAAGVAKGLAFAVAAAMTTALAVSFPETDAGASQKPERITIAYAGDSTTAQPDSWLFQLRDPSIKIAGGFAHDGFTSWQIASRVEPVAADVLVVMVGINDFHRNRTNHIGLVLRQVDKIVERVGARHQLISAVAPSNITRHAGNGVDSQAAQEQLDDALAAHAQQKGWTFIDPYAEIRNRTTNGYSSPSYTLDGVHPTAQAYEMVAAQLRLGIRLLMGYVDN